MVGFGGGRGNARVGGCKLHVGSRHAGYERPEHSTLHYGACLMVDLRDLFDNLDFIDLLDIVPDLLDLPGLLGLCCFGFASVRRSDSHVVCSYRTAPWCVLAFGLVLLQRKYNRPGISPAVHKCTIARAANG